MKALLAIVLLAMVACTQVDTGHRGIEVQWKEVTGEPKKEGLYFYNPIKTSIIQMSVKEEKYAGKTSIFTKDTQRTDVEFAVIWSIEPGHVGNLFKDIGNQDQIEDKILRPVVLGSVKDAIGQIIADDLISKRESATQSALDTIRRNLESRHIKISDLQFTDIDFDDNYERAVEEKVVAIQQAQKAKNETVRVKEVAAQTVMTATAQAEAMRIKSAALAQNKGLVEFELAQKWDGKLPQYMFGNSTPMINFKAIGGQ